MNAPTLTRSTGEPASRAADSEYPVAVIQVCSGVSLSTRPTTATATTATTNAIGTTPPTYSVSQWVASRSTIRIGPASEITSATAEQMLRPPRVTMKDGIRSSTWASPCTAPIAPAAAMTATVVSPPRSGSHIAKNTVESEHSAAIDRSMPPQSTTSVAPVARTTSGAEVRTTAVRLRWVRKSGSARVSAASSATSAMTGMKDVSRWPAVGPPWTAAVSATGVAITGVDTVRPSP